MGDQQFVFDQFKDQPDKLPRDIQYENLMKFVHQYGQTLTGMESALGDFPSDVWDMFSDPVRLEFEPRSTQTLEDILGFVNRDNKIFFKLMLTLPSICCELSSLVAEAKEKYIPPLSLFGEQTVDTDASEGDVITFGRILPLLQDLWNFCERVYSVVCHLIRQLASLYCKNNRKKTSPLAAYMGVHFQPVWRALGEALGILITFDELIRQNESFTNCATVFKRMMRTVRNSPEKYDTDGPAAKRFEFLMAKLEGDLLDDLIYQNCVDREFDERLNGIFVKENQEFQVEFFTMLNMLFEYFMRDAPGEINKRYSYIGYMGLVVMYTTIFREKCRKDKEYLLFLKKIWESQKKFTIIHLGNMYTFHLGEWLARRIPEFVNSQFKNRNQDVAASKHSLLAQVSDIEGLVQGYYNRITVWSSKLESKHSIESENQRVVTEQIGLLMHGVIISWDVSNLLKNFLLGHVVLEQEFSGSKILSAMRLVEMLKAILNTYHRQSSTIGNLQSLLVDKIGYQISRKISPLKGKLEHNQQRLDDAQIDQLSALELILHVSQGAPTKTHIMLMRMALAVAMNSMAAKNALVNPSELADIAVMIRNLEVLSHFQVLLSESCDCSVLYWFEDAFDVYFKAIVRSPELVNGLPYILLALHDTSPMLLKVQHLGEADTLLNAFIKRILKRIDAIISHTVKRAIEDDLRLHIHSVVLGSDSRDLSTLKQKEFKDWARFIQLPAMNFFGQQLSFRASVEEYLDVAFYNLTAIASHDWKTYEELRSLAKEKFDINLMEVHLPGATLEQGLDVLEITRNIHVFVGRYNYNLNGQMFVEKPATTKSNHLHTIHIRHIANSIRTHGAGIMNTTVNFVYQFLGKKFFIFSQFLYDDHIKSRLMKDYRSFREQKAEYKGLYPFKKAEKFLKDIKKLGVTEDNKSYLDQFRELVTEIGNALGYVRMVRSGGFRYISESIKFVPDLSNVISLGEAAVDAELPEQTINAAVNLDNLLNDMITKFSEGADYFKMLEDVFYDEMHKEKNQHLKNFFVIIPPLMLSYVEYIIQCKEKVNKKNKEATFTDDGFALGIAFVLKLLRQEGDFDGLQWEESWAFYYDANLRAHQEQMEEKRREREQMKKGKQKSKAEAAENEINTMTLSQNKIHTSRRESDELFKTFHSCAVFFKDRNKDDKRDEDEEDEEEEEEYEEA